MIKSSGLYLSITLIILAWWSWAFQRPQNSFSTSSQPASATVKKHEILALLSPLERETLKKALAGDYILMSKLIADWDVDAQILSSHGSKAVKRLMSNDFLRSQLLGRQMQHHSNKARQRKFLPQSYAAASFLLTLVKPEQIVALPNGLRRQVQIYDDALMAQIPLDVDRYNSEKLFLAQPDVAFVSAYYSHPSAIQALRNQGIHIHATRSVATLADIKLSLTEIGHIVEREREAELLNIFIEASLHAIENRLIALNPDRPQAISAAKILYINHYDQFYFPCASTVSCELLHRLGIDPRSSNTVTPLELERIVTLNPDYLIISSSHSVALKRQLQSDPALQNVSALLNQHVYFVDDDLQQTPTHYVVLAYYDLAQVLAQADRP